MGIRIRYENNGECLQSVRTFIAADGMQYRVFLFENNLTFQITCTTTQFTFVDGAVSSARLRAKAKKYLESMGVSFSNESRAARITVAAA